MYFTIKCNIQPNNTLEITYTTKAKKGLSIIRIKEYRPSLTTSNIKYISKLIKNKNETYLLGTDFLH